MTRNPDRAKREHQPRDSWAIADARIAGLEQIIRWMFDANPEYGGPGAMPPEYNDLLRETLERTEDRRGR